MSIFFLSCYIDYDIVALEQYHTPGRGTLENMPPAGQTLCRPQAAYFPVARGQGCDIDIIIQGESDLVY